jgi:hypothetical protein
MQSRNEFELDNLPEPTPEDIAALERADQLNQMDSSAYLRFLSTLTANLPASRETNSDTDEPFEL